MDINREKLYKYIQCLFTFLDNKVYCFNSGAFVIEDNDQELFNLLYNILPHEHPAISSHTTYLTDKRIFKLKSSVFETKFSIDCNLTVEVECDINNEKKTNTFKMIKWYTFKNGDNHYIFIKPETTCGSNNFEHILDATKKKYIDNLYTPNLDKKLVKTPYTQIISRREDCKKFKNDPCLYNKLQNIDKPFLMFRNTIIMYYNKIMEKTSQTTYSNIETYKRKGDEVFIIEPVSKFILETIHSNRVFVVQYVDDINYNTIKITNLSKYNYSKYKKHILNDKYLSSRSNRSRITKSQKTARSKSPKTARSKSPKTARSKSPKTARSKSPKTARSKSPKTARSNVWKTKSSESEYFQN
jgi:hypothetical protein